MAIIKTIVLMNYDVVVEGSFSITPCIELGTKDSYGTEKVRVIFRRPGWSGLEALAVFHAPGGSATKKTVGADGILEVPPEATADNAGRGKIVFLGLANGLQRITVDLPYSIRDHSGIDGDNPGTPTPDVVQQILENSNNAVRVAQAAKDAAENAHRAAEDAAIKAGEEAGGAAASAAAAAASAGTANAAKNAAAEAAYAAGNAATSAAAAATAAGKSQNAALQSEMRAATSAEAAAKDANSIGEAAAKATQEAGAAAVMPLGSLIGSNMGLRMRDFIEIIIANAHVPVIIDAGIGRPSQACDAMEMGADAVMAYTAIASAGNIPLMARAFKHAIESGREAYLSGLGTVTEGHAVPSSPTNAADYLH